MKLLFLICFAILSVNSFAGTCTVKGVAWSRVCDRAKKFPYTRVVVKDQKETATAEECLTLSKEIFQEDRSMGACQQTKKLTHVSYKFKSDEFKVTGKFSR